MQRPRTVHEAITLYGDEGHFEPLPSPLLVPTSALPGTPEKIAVLARRVEIGLPLWHELDARSHEGRVGGVLRHSTKEELRMSAIEERQVSTTDEHVVRKDLGTH